LLAESPRITGTVLQAVGICRRQVWFLTHSISADQDNDLLMLGRIIDQNSYSRERHQALFGNNKFDFMQTKDGTLVISEIKKSSRAEKASILQLAHYLYELEKEGITAKGLLLYPEEKKRMEVALDDRTRHDLEKNYEEIRAIARSTAPEPLAENKYCRQCAYSEYCWS